MKVEELLFKLQKQLKEPLPGEEFQYELAPLSRREEAEALRKKAGYKKAAVLILLYPKGETVKFILIVRPSYEGVHSAQVAFPGGKIEVNETAEEAALREASEEIGVKPESVNVIGKLSELYIPPSNFLVYPVVGVITSEPYFIKNNYEVESIVEADLNEFLQKVKVKSKKIKVSSGYLIETPFYDYKGLTIWGATAMMLSEFLEVVKRAGD